MRSIWLVGVVTIIACGAKEEADAYKAKSQATEAKLMLNRMSKNLKTHFVERETYPAGKAGPSPAEPCCKGAGAKCAVTSDWAKDPVWSAMDFELSEPHRFQYSYQSDGKTVVATAVGDLDCDGTTITYKLDMAVGNAGEPTVTFTDGNPADD